MKMERPRMHQAIADDDDDDSITWDELDDTINFVRRQSVQSTDIASASSLDNNIQKHSSRCGSVDEEASDDDDNDDGDNIEPWQKRHAMKAQQSLSSLLRSGSNDDEFHPDKLRPKRRSIKKTSARRIQNSDLRGSNTSWDDLGDEISKALQQSMMIENDPKSNLEVGCEDSAPLSSTIDEKAGFNDGPWNCQACTFLNENPLHLVCAICGSAKVAQVPAPAPVDKSSRHENLLRRSGSAEDNPRRSLASSMVSMRSNRSEAENDFGTYQEQELNFSRRREKGNFNGRHSTMGGASSSSVTSRSRSGPAKDFRRDSRKSLRASFRPGERGFGGSDLDDGSYSSDERIGGRVGADEFDDEDQCSDLSDEETLVPDDTTIQTMKTIKTLRVPEGEVTIIYTDVQGSTSLWEADPLSMKKATDIHDSIIRKCYADHSGYEITTEGDAFNLAFQHPADAIGFALKAQLQLFRAKWPEGILNHPDGCHNEKKAFRGFRVRFGMHHGPTTSTVHETTGRTVYQGEAVDVAKAIEKMSHGGQILTTVETWRAVSGMAEQFLGKPQVMDCGEHLLHDPKKAKAGKKIPSKRIVQLVPHQLSYDFFAARGGQEVAEGETPPRVCGRVFPPLLSNGQLSTSFLNAPYIGNRVAMVFVYTDKMESITDNERKKNHKILAKFIRSHLMRLTPPGYECQEDKGSWMLAFDRIENGIKFGLDLNESVAKCSDIRGDVDAKQLFRIGIHWGPFLSMGPHTVSGHADYFGPIVNRAARVAAQCEPGQICVGVPMGGDEEPPDPGPSVEVDVLGVKQLKGISIEMAIFSCRKKAKPLKGK